MHAVRKESSTTTKLRVVFDASAKTASGASLNDQLLVGPTVHSSLIDVLIRFRRHKIAMTTDVSKMYRAILLSKEQRDLHRFVCREDRTQSLRDYRMTRLTFGVSASPFAANMALKQNALDFQQEYPRAAQPALNCFYVDDGLVGADSVEDAICLQDELQHLFSAGGFTLKKWKTSNKTVEENIPSHLRDQVPTQLITWKEVLTWVLGVEWDATTDAFKPLVPITYEVGKLTKRRLLSEVAKLFDVLGWCSPAIIIPKILIQRLWEENLDWDELVTQSISNTWEQWISTIMELRQCSIPRNYFPLEADVTTVQLHGFCDASERAYARARLQLLGQLPKARLNPGDVFRDTGVDYAGPLYIKSGSIRKPVFTKCYVAVFVSLSVKAIHLEPVTELTTSAFIATLRRFVARRGLPTTIWSDHGTNFVGAANEINRLVRDQELSDHWSRQGIRWRFMPEHAPHFGGLWEAAVKSFKLHLRRVVDEARLTYEES